MHEMRLPAGTVHTYYKVQAQYPAFYIGLHRKPAILLKGKLSEEL